MAVCSRSWTAKPWLEEGIIGDFDGTGAMSLPAAKIGMGVFLAVVGSLFALLISAYFMRSGYTDWQSIRIPQLLWVNTGALILSQRRAARPRKARCIGKTWTAVKFLLLVARLFGIAFLVGQLWVWRELSDAGFLLASNPSNSFFYLITGLHGLHMVGGVAGLGWTTDRAWRGVGADKMRLSVEMCTMYWHFLLIVWLVLFSLLTGLAEDFGEICRQLLT